MANDFFTFISDKELLLAGLGALALVEALGHDGPFVADELRFEDDRMDKRTPTEGGGLLARRVHESRGLKKAGQFGVTDRRAGVVFFVIHVRESLLVASDAGVTHGAIWRLALESDLKPGADYGIAVLPDRGALLISETTADTH